jgi:hypothetical protein
VTWAANQLLLLTGASTVSAVTISPTVQALLGSSSNAAFLAAIGGVDSTGLPPKATSADLIAGTDNTKYVSSSVLPSVYAQRTFDVAANQGSGFTLGAAFNGQVIPWTNASAGTITLDPAAPKGTEALISCEGAGQITFAAGSGATVQSRGARLKSNGQYSQITAYVISNAGSAAAWRLGGDLTT